MTVVNVNTPRLIAAAIAYAAGILLTDQIGTAALDTIATAATSTWRALGTALGAWVSNGDILG